MTLQEQYNLIKEGKGHKGIFLTEAKKQFPNMLTNPMGFNEASKMLKTRGVISENYIDLQPINTMEATPKTSYELKFADFLAEAKKEAKEENIKVDAKKTDKSVDEVNAHGFDAKDKKNLDNQIGQEVLNGIYFEAKQNPDKDLEEIRKIVSKNLEKDGQYYIKNAAFGVEGLGYQETEVEEVSGKHKASGYSDKLKTLVKESLLKEEKSIQTKFYNSLKPGDTVIYNSKSKNGIEKGDEVVVSAVGSNSTLEKTITVKKGNKKVIVKGHSGLKPLVKESLIGSLKEEEVEEAQIEEAPKPDFADIDGDGDKKEPVKKAAKDKKKKVKKETLESKLAEIDKQGAVVALEAKIDMVDEVIESKNSRISMVSEDENLSELVDEAKIKSMQKEVKLLEKQKAKMEKMYEKMCGKTYTKEEIIDETYSEDE